ncbi:MAG: PAS domain-containing protein, partial [Sulfuricella sp.]|nr:PAS domain-containing protein [Sulfuricella sp.]
MNKDQQPPHDLAHRLRLLEVLDRITQVSLASENMEDVLSGVLDLVLEVFNADRAWFLYPCDPDAPSWGVPMERTRPEWPGLFVRGVDMPMDSSISEVASKLLRANGPIQYGPETGHQVPPLIAEHFFVKSQVTIALRPKIGKPWIFGLHHCATEVRHDEQELQLFTAVAQRISDSLSSLISIKQLRESEIRLQTQADIALQQSERHLKEAQSLARIGSWDYSLASGQLMWSDELYRIYGVSRETSTPNIEPLINLIHPDDQAAMRSWIEACASGQKPEALEFRCIWPDGTIRYIEGQGELILDAEGMPGRISGTAQDITERKLAEMALHESESRWRSFTQNSPDHIIMIDPEEVIRFINHTVPDLTPEQVVGTPITGYLPEKFRPIAHACYQRVLNSGLPDRYETEYC